MKKSLIFIIVFVALILLCINTASAKQVFVPSQYVNGQGFVPGHWMAVPDNYPNGRCNNSDLFNALIQQKQMDNQGFDRLINTMKNWTRENNQHRMFQQWLKTQQK